MNNALVFQIVLVVLLWLATGLFLLGKGKILGVGHNLLPIKGKEALSEEEIKKQCKYIAIVLLLPLSAIFTALTVGEILEAAWLEWITSRASLGILAFIILFGYIFYLISRINAGKYWK